MYIQANGKRMRECLYSVKSSNGTEPEKGSWFTPGNKQFWVKRSFKNLQLTNTVVWQLVNSSEINWQVRLQGVPWRYHNLKPPSSLGSGWKEIHCPPAEKFNIENSKTGSYMLFGTECDSHTHTHTHTHTVRHALMHTGPGLFFWNLVVHQFLSLM